MKIRSHIKKTTKRLGRAFGLSEINDDLVSFKETLGSLEDHLSRLENTIVHNHNTSLEEHSCALLERINRLEKINELYFEASFRNPEESSLDMRKRFFRKLPEATGDLRLIQLGCIKMLRELDAICKKNNIPYWISDGTLLGAVRHGGIIPWDDDVDTYMLRSDIHRLEEAVKTTGYKVNIAYDPYVFSKQVRFMSKDKQNPCFVDIFIYDYGTIGTQDAWYNWLNLRKEQLASLKNSKDPMLKEWRKRGVINRDEGDAIIGHIDNLFEETFGDIVGPIHTGGPLGIIIEPMEDQNYYIVDGLDNMSPIANPTSPRIYHKNEIFPLQDIEYENIPFPCPKDSQNYLSDMYGDIYTIPDDLVSHYKHIVLDEASVKTISKFLNEKK